MCPGRIDKTESSSGAPKNIDFIKSINVWVIAIAIMNITKNNGEVILRRAGEKVTRKIAMRFIWIPGKRPVIVPANVPKRRARIRESISSKEFEIIKRFINELY